MNRRLLNEYTKLKKKYKTKISFNEDQDYKTITLLLNYNLIQIKISNQNFTKYPFTPPEIFVNNKYYNDMLQTINVNDYIKFIRKTQCCILCDSISCTNNWNPLCKIQQIINEVDLLMTNKKRIIEKNICNEIEKKWNIPKNLIIKFL